MGQGLSPAYWRLWRSAAAGNLADGVVQAALPLLIIGYTTSPLVVAGVTTVMTLPWLAVVLVGVVVDRGDRRMLLSASGLSRTAVLGVVALTLWFEPSGVAAVVVVYATAIAMGAAETFAETSAGALVPTVAPPALLPRANGRLHGASLAANQFLGPPLAGLVVAAGASVAMGVPAVGYAAAGLMALQLPTDRHHGRADTGWSSALWEGVRFVSRHAALRRLVMVTGLWNLASGMAFSVLVLFAVAPGPMGLSEPQYGLLLASGGAGGLAGSLLTEQLLNRATSPMVIGASVAVGAVALAAPAVTSRTAPIALALAAGGFASVATGVTIVSARQVLTPNALLGRVNATFWTASAGLYPLGALAGGLIAETAGLRTTFALAGFVAAVGLAAVSGLDGKDLQTSPVR